MLAMLEAAPITLTASQLSTTGTYLRSGGWPLGYAGGERPLLKARKRRSIV